MSTQVPYLSRLGIYRISIEKQETLIKLMVLSTCAILCKLPEMRTCSLPLSLFNTIVIELFIFAAFSTRLFAVLRFESVIHEFDP